MGREGRREWESYSGGRETEGDGERVSEGDAQGLNAN